MRRTLHIGKEPDLQKIIIASALIHLLFFSLVALPFRAKEGEHRTYFVNLVAPAEMRKSPKTPATKKSVKGKTQKGRTKIKPALKRRPKPKSKPKIIDRAAREIERLRAISALSKKRRQKEKQTAMAREANEEIAKAIEGLRKKKPVSISRGAGIPSHASSAASESYYALVTQKIWSEWIPPDYEATGLEAVISIKIARDGKVVSQKIERTSGNMLFDRSASKAISKASPLPPPPAEMEIGVRFYL